MRLNIVLAALLLWPAVALADPTRVEMTRSEANAVFNAINIIGQYQTTIKQGGQDVAISKFLDVTSAMRSTLIHDTAVLRYVLLETAKLQEDSHVRNGDTPAYSAELLAIGQEKVQVDGLILFKQEDLQLDKNPQITPMLGAALTVLESREATVAKGDK